jgi:hypothetical protein
MHVIYLINRNLILKWEILIYEIELLNRVFMHNCTIRKE